MSDLLKLRPYQEEAVAAVEADWARGVRRPAAVMACGTGKTRTAANIIDRRDVQTLFLVHRDELAEQSRQAFHDQGLNVGVVQAEQNDVGAKIIVGSIQTLQNPRRLAQLPPTSLVVCDEAHLSGSPSWRSVLTGLGVIGPQPRTDALGLSATLSRTDGAGLGDIWDRVAYTYDIEDGIRDGYLLPPVGRIITVNDLDLRQAAMVGGEFAAGSLSDMLRSSGAREAVVKAYREHAAEMPGIVFTPDVRSAQEFAEAFNDAGFVTEAVWGAMPTEDRRRIIREYKAEKIQILVNCGIFTVGTDLPRAQCAVMARPMSSKVLYTQAAGRVLRLYPGQDHALILDISGASADHRLATFADLFPPAEPKEKVDGDTQEETGERGSRTGTLQGAFSSREIDLFRSSRSVWLRTYDGTWFIPAGNAAIFIWPSRELGLHHVAICSLEQNRRKLLKRDLDLDAAMSWGEQIAEEYQGAWQERNGKKFGMARKASWRSSKPSPAMISYAKRLGLDPSGTPRAGALSDIIERERVSRVLDRKGTG